MARTGIVAVAVVVAVAALDGGCSWLVVRTPSEPPTMSSEGMHDCTVSRLAPGIDVTETLFLGLIGVGATTVAIVEGGDADGEIVPMAIVADAAAIGFGSSAAYGMRATGRCRDQIGWSGPADDQSWVGSGTAARELASASSSPPALR
jgi:hypothetical protein